MGAGTATNVGRRATPPTLDMLAPSITSAHPSPHGAGGVVEEALAVEPEVEPEVEEATLIKLDYHRPPEPEHCSESIVDVCL